MEATVHKEQWNFHQQLWKLMKELNLKERKKQGSNPKLIFGKLEFHFVNRLFQRVKYIDINPVVTEMLHYIFNNKVTIRNAVTPIPTEYRFPVKKYIVCIELRNGGRCVGDDESTTVIVHLKTVIQKDD